MNSKSLKKLIATLAAAMTLAGALGSTAFARTLPASAGAPTAGSQMANWNISAFGVSTTASGTWLIPVPLDNSGSKSITVLGRANAGTTLSCFAFSLSSTGTLLGVSNTAAFTANGTFQNVTLNMAAALVPGAAQVSVGCSFSGSGTAISGINFNQ